MIETGPEGRLQKRQDISVRIQNDIQALTGMF